MARIAANPRVKPDVLTAGVWQLMADAMDVSYVEFERRAPIFESLADPIGAAGKTERNHQRRNALMHQNTDGGWALHASFDEVGGPEFSEIFSWFVDREFNNDWAAAIKTFGDGNVHVTKLPRTEAQRRTDAILEMARAAAACPPDRNRPLPTVNFIFDANTAAAAADGELLDPLEYRDVVSRTDRGNRVTSWSTRGPTNPDNGAPLCARHNYLKEHAFTVVRDDNGHWHITAPDGNDICCVLASRESEQEPARAAGRPRVSRWRGGRRRPPRSRAHRCASG